MEKPPYYAVRRGRAYFEIGKARAERCGMASSYALGLDGPLARAAAWKLYHEWKSGPAPSPGKDESYPQGSLGHWYLSYRQGRRWAMKSPATRKEWEVCWRRIAPVLGRRPLREITAAEFETFQVNLESEAGPTTRWRVIKIARALFKSAETYGVLARSPAMTLPNPQSAGRTQIWLAHEIADLMAAAEAANRKAMRLAIWIAWETLFQPIDVRRLTLGQRRKDGSGFHFATRRAKTGREAFGAISDGLSQAIDDYVASLPLTLPPSAPFLRTVRGHEYIKARFLDDFDLVRTHAFGNEETRRFQDIRRSGNVEADLAGVSAEDRAAILANALHKDPFLEATYTPPTITKARKVAEQRKVGRELLDRERRNMTGAALKVVGTKPDNSEA